MIEYKININQGGSTGDSSVSVEAGKSSIELFVEIIGESSCCVALSDLEAILLMEMINNALKDMKRIEELKSQHNYKEY